MHLLLNLLLQLVQIRGTWVGLNALQRMHLLLYLLLQLVQIRGTCVGLNALHRMHLLPSSAASDGRGSPLTANIPAHVAPTSSTHTRIATPAARRTIHAFWDTTAPSLDWQVDGLSRPTPPGGIVRTVSGLDRDMQPGWNSRPVMPTATGGILP
jgi:hypothetical protein